MRGNCAVIGATHETTVFLIGKMGQKWQSILCSWLPQLSHSMRLKRVAVLLRTVVKGVQPAVGARSLVAELAPNPVVVVMGLAVVPEALARPGGLVTSSRACRSVIVGGVVGGRLVYGAEAVRRPFFRLVAAPLLLLGEGGAGGGADDVVVGLHFGVLNDLSKHGTAT